MSNLSRLTDAGLVSANANFNESDMNTINSLSDDEVSALISVSQKVPSSFLQQHCSTQSTAPSPSGRTVGIVF